MFSWQNILEKSVMPVCVSFREKVTHRHTCTCATGYTLTHPLPQITVTHLHMSADTCNTCKYMHTLKWIWLHFSGHLSIMKNDPEKWSSVFHGCYPMEFSEGFVSEGPLLPTWNIILDRQNGVGGSEGISKENHRNINPFFQKYWPSI